MVKKRTIIIGSNVEIEAHGRKFDIVTNILRDIPKTEKMVHRDLPTSIIELISLNGVIFKKR